MVSHYKICRSQRGKRPGGLSDHFSHDTPQFCGCQSAETDICVGPYDRQGRPEAIDPDLAIKKV